MKQFQCTSEGCGSIDISTTIGVNPNDRTEIKNFIFEGIQDGSIEDNVHWCNKCNDYCRVAIVDIDISQMSPEQLFQQWQKGQQDLFIASANYYRQIDNESLGGEEKVFFTFEQAKKYIEHYIRFANVKTNKDTYHVFKIRYINIPVCEREKHTDSQSLIDDYHFEIINPIFEIRI